jgi:hypothetical protein
MCFNFSINTHILGKAVKYCATCESAFCDECCDVWHHDDNENNTVANNGAPSSSVHDIKPVQCRTPKCAKHPASSVDYYCEVEKSLFCLKCKAMGAHRLHTFHDISQVASKVRQSLGGQSRELAEMNDKLRAQLEEVQRDMQGSESPHVHSFFITTKPFSSSSSFLLYFFLFNPSYVCIHAYIL